jgi:UbiD family decarboxylase
MNVTIDPRTAKSDAQPAINKPKQDLRAWLAALEAHGELQSVKGADREEEIGGIVDIYQRTIGSPAVMFDDVPGYPSGYRVMANILTSVRRINLTLGLDVDSSEMALVGYWRNYMKNAKTIPPVEVKSGPLLDNVATGDEINLLKIPTPKWHEHDGGYYIGTGCMVIMKDPDTGWINYGAYRIQCHDRGDDLQRQARQSDHAQISRARRALPDRRGGRHAPGTVHGGRDRDSLRQERIRCSRRADWRGRGDHSWPRHGAADPGAC